MEQDQVSSKARLAKHANNVYKKLSVWIDGYFGGYFALQTLQFRCGTKLQQKFVLGLAYLRNIAPQRRGCLRDCF